MADTATLTPEELLYYSQQRAAADRGYKQANNRLVYERGINDQDYGYNLGDLQKRFKGIYESMPGQYARRGVLTSGIAKGGYEKYGTEYADAIGRLNQQNQQQLDAYGIQQGELDTSHTAAIQDLTAQEEARKSAAAASYRSAQYG